MSETAVEVRAPAEVTNERALVLLESLDTELIVAELEGRAVSQWAYRFDQEGAPVTGLTVAGVEQCSRESAKHGEALRVLGEPKWYPMDVDKDGVIGAWFAVVTVGRFAVTLREPQGERVGQEILLDTAIGTKKEPLRKYSWRKKRWYDNPNALDVAISKAARNAKKKLLDPLLVERVLQAALDGGRIAAPTEQRQREALREAAKEAMPAPDMATVKEGDSRSRFFATARELGLPTQSAVHARLRTAIGLQCPEGSLHEGDETGDGPVRAADPRVCHALRAEVERFARLPGADRAAGWDSLIASLDPEPVTEAEAWE